WSKRRGDRRRVNPFCTARSRIPALVRSARLQSRCMTWMKNSGFVLTASDPGIGAD
ncbi:MAG: hypothetical protein AVDCRST_MAG71-2711, partial [uncultured Lysobacter sp.]